MAPKQTKGLKSGKKTTTPLKTATQAAKRKEMSASKSANISSDEDDDEEEEIDEEDLDSEDMLQDPGEEGDSDSQEAGDTDSEEEEEEDNEEEDSEEEGAEDTDSQEDNDSCSQEVAGIKLQNGAKKKAALPNSGGLKHDTEIKNAKSKAVPHPDEQTLFIKNLATDTKEADLRSLSKDIIEIRKRVAMSGKHIFAYLVFPSEKVAEKNYKLLQGKKFKGKKIIVDYVGSKSTVRPMSSSAPPPGVKFDPKRLFVSGLGKTFTDKDLKKLFPQAEDAVVIRRRNGQSLGYGFVSFTNEATAEKNLNKYKSGVDISGQTVVAAYAKVRHTNSTTKKKGPEEDKKRLYVCGLGPNVKETDLLSMYPKATEIQIRQPTADRPRYAFVTFTSEQAASKSLEKSQGAAIKGHVVKVSYANKKGDTAKRKAETVVKEPKVKKAKASAQNEEEQSEDEDAMESEESDENDDTDDDKEDSSDDDDDDDDDP